jgi:GalNAc-alpha-(1->4)-GalNAc-alpha-(1->3)-diNAcBac-PP-undecaprenol alpha-1,4-N-acetyl-D-galactosaminyltransferase
MERVMAELANQFVQKENLELHLVLYGIDQEQFYELDQRVIIHKPSFKFNNRLRLISTLKTLLFLRSEISKIRPKAVLSFGEMWNNFVLLALLFKPFPIYVSDRSQPDKPLGLLHEKLRKFLYPMAKGLIAQTSRAQQHYQKILRHNNITVIGNPIRAIEHTSNDIPNKENIVLMVGRLIRSKNQVRLVRIFAEVAKEDWKLVLVGYDHLKQNYTQKVKETIAELGMGHQVILAGKQTDVEAFYLKSKIFAFTSSSEGFPNVVGEAMSAGLPIISYDCSAGPSDLIKHGQNGFLIPQFEDSYFKECLQELMQNDALANQMGKASKELIREFEISKIAEKYYQFIVSNENKINR